MMKKGRPNLLLALVVMIAIAFSPVSYADSLSYSGRLVNANGSPVIGPVDLKFELAYSGNTALIKCNEDISGIILTNGVFHTKLQPTCGTSLAEVLANVPPAEEVVIRVTNVTANPDKVYSFQALHSVPFSQISNQLVKMGAANDEVLTWTGTKWEPKAITGATGGTVTSITAGTGLSGGTIVNSGTIAIANGGVTDALVATGIARAKLANGTANYVLVNDGTGFMSEVAQLPLTQGGTGANTAAGARTNLGLGSAAVSSVGYGVGQVMPGDGVPICLAHQKLQMNLGPTFWSCVNDNDSLDATKLPLAGGTMAGAINMNNSQINNLADPILDGDAANKLYVDTKFGSVSSSQWTTVVSDIFYNTGKVGIGTNTPSYLLHVKGAGWPLHVEGDALISGVSRSNTLQVIQRGTNTTPAIRYFNDPDTGFVFPSNGVIAISTANAERLRVDGSGLNVNGDVALSGKLRLKSDNANYVELKSPAALAASLVLNLPGTNGTSGQALITDGAGNLSWASVATGASAVGGDLTGTVTNAQIAAGAIVDADIAAGAAIDQSKINGLSTSLSGKEPTINAGTTAQYWRGDKSWQTLNSAAVPELTNLYFTEPRVLGTDLAGYAATTGAITVADTVLSAIEKLSGNLAATSAAQANYVLKAGDTMSGPLAMGNNKITGLATPTVGTDAATMAYVDSKVAAAPGDNLGNHTATTNLGMGANNITGTGRIYVGDGAFNLPSHTFTSATGTGLYNNGGNLGFSASGSLVMTMSNNALNFNGSYGAYIRSSGTNDATAPTYAFNSDNNTGMFNLSTDILGFTTNGVERMRILSTGEVAIGKATAAGKLDVAGDIATDGKLRLKSDNANYVELKAPASLAATLSYTFPGSAGTSGYALTTNGAGVLSWSAVATTASTVGGDLSGTIAAAQIVADAVTTAEILDGTIVNADIANTTITYGKLNLTDGDIPQAKVNGLVTALTGKEPTITAGTTAQYWRGDKTWQSLITTNVPEGTNLYFTQPRVLASLMSGYTAGTAIPINVTDTVSQAFGKLEAQIVASNTNFSNSGVWSKNAPHVYYSAGNVGVGITAPTAPLHVVTTAGNSSIFQSSNTSYTNMQINNTSSTRAWNLLTVGSTAGAYGVAGSFTIDEAGSGARMTIIPGGNMGVGTYAPSARLHVKQSTDLESSGLLISNTATTGNTAIFVDAASKTHIGGMTASPNALIIDNVNGNIGLGILSPSEKLEVNGNVKAPAYLYTSDRRLKKNIKTIDDSLEKVLMLRGVEFDWKESNEHEVGLIAQEVEAVEPNLVETSASNGMKSVKYGNIVALLIEAIKKQETRAVKAEREISSLKDENKKLREEIELIKKHLKIK